MYTFIYIHAYHLVGKKIQKLVSTGFFLYDADLFFRNTYFKKCDHDIVHMYMYAYVYI